MEQIELKTTNRDILGKKVKVLRRQGITPMHLFGHGIESVALQCDTTHLLRVLVEAGRTGLISLKLDNEKGPRNVMIREVQLEPVAGGLLHVDFYQVRMAEAIKVNVPVVLVGEAPVLKSKEHMLVQELSALAVECLPAKTPAHVEMDLSSLTEPEQVVRVKDIKLDKEVTVLRDPELVVVRVTARPVEIVGERAEAAAAVEAPAATSSGAEAPKEE